MGSPPDEEGRRNDEGLHRVMLTRGLWLGVCPVTQAQWRAVMGGSPAGDAHPATRVSWQDRQGFCRRAEAAGVRVRLPTEAEWEWACRAGTTTPFHFGGTISPEQANYNSKNAYGGGRKVASRGTTTPAGSFPPNAWGLFPGMPFVLPAHPPGEKR